MATRPTRDFAVTGYDPSAESRTRAAARGLPLADTAAAAARGAAAVVVAVRTLDHAEQALFGPDGAVEAAPDVVLLTSTFGVPGPATWGERLAACGVPLLYAPASGGPARAGHGDLLVFLGGSDEAVERAGPVVAALSSRAARVGSRPGDGQSVKVVKQLLCGPGLAAHDDSTTVSLLN